MNYALLMAVPIVPFWVDRMGYFSKAVLFLFWKIMCILVVLVSRAGTGANRLRFACKLARESQQTPLRVELLQYHSFGKNQAVKLI